MAWLRFDLILCTYLFLMPTIKLIQEQWVELLRNMSIMFVFVPQVYKILTILLFFTSTY